MRTKSLVWISFFWLILSPTTYAQEAFTLDEAVQYSLENSVEMRKARYDMEAAKSRVNEIKSAGLPQINGSIGYNYNYLLQRTPSPGAFDIFGAYFARIEQLSGLEGLPPVTQVPTTPEDENEDEGITFQFKNQAQAAITVQQLLFDGTFFLGLKAANAYTDLVEEIAEVNELNIAAQVAKSYYAVLINEKQLVRLKQNLAQIDSLKTQTELMYEAGYTEKIDVSRLASNLNTLKAQMSNLERNIILGKQLLKFQMGYPVDQEITLLSAMDPEEMMADLMDEQVIFEKRPDYRLYNLQVELEELNVRQYKVGYYPNIYANANIGASNSRDTLSELFSETWFPQGSVGFSISIPIFDGLRKKAQIEQAKVGRLKAEADLSNVKQGILLEVQQAKISYANALSNLSAQAENRDLNEEIFRLSNIKFKEGVGSSLDIVQAETGLIDARIEFFSAYYNALVARIDYLKAIGSLLESDLIK